MQSYIDEMLGLTADVAEELLALKDTGGRVSDALAGKMSRLAELALKDAAHPEDDAVEVVGSCQGTLQEPQLEEPVAMTTADIVVDNLAAQNGVEADDVLQSSDYIAAGNPENVEETSQPMAGHAEIGAEPEENASDSGLEVSDGVAEGASGAPVRGSSELKRIFSLNDMFLYRRMLFKGSSLNFNEVLDMVPSLRSAEELRQLLSGRYEVDLKSEEAKDFMEIVLPYINLDRCNDD